MVIEFWYQDTLLPSEWESLYNLYNDISPAVKAKNKNNIDSLCWKVPDLKKETLLSEFYNLVQVPPHKLRMNAIKISVPINSYRGISECLDKDFNGQNLFEGLKCDISFWNAVKADCDVVGEYKYYFNNPVIPQYPLACELYFKNIEKIFDKIPFEYITRKKFWEILEVNTNKSWNQHFGEHDIMKSIYDEVYPALHNIQLSCVQD